jgi:predicted RNase H-like nuclease
MRLVGVDGCRSGWVVASSDFSPTGDRPLAAPSFSIVRTFAALTDVLQACSAVIAVDMPIGLPSGAPRDDGRRPVDAEARRFLGPARGSSVFSAPCRPTLAAREYREACALEVAARGSGQGLSQQAYRIIPKLREVDLVVEPRHQEPIRDGAGIWIREAHPEVVFAVLAGDGQPGHGLAHSKRGCKRCVGAACPGERQRLTILQRYLPDFEPREIHQRLIRDHHRPAGQRGPAAGRDDVVDAAACLVAALRIAQGVALTLPAGAPEYDARGLRMEIVV